MSEINDDDDDDDDDYITANKINKFCIVLKPLNKLVLLVLKKVSWS